MGKEILLTPLLKLLHELSPLEDSLQNLLIDSFNIEIVQKGKILLSEGEIWRNLWFLAKDLLRSYHSIDDKEITSRIMFTNHIVISAGSFYFLILQTPQLVFSTNCTNA